MPKDANGNWYPEMFPKQIEVFNAQDRVLLVVGPRLSGKTMAVCQRICRHLWETPDARVIMFAKTMKSSKNAGTWDLLINRVMPEWIKANIGFRFTTENRGIPGPKTDGITRTPHFKVTNMHGGESEMLLFSLDNDDDVETKIKNLACSMIFFSELDNFGDRRVLMVGMGALRMPHLGYDDQMWIADCNPSEDGEQSWIYKMFYHERGMSYEDHCDYQKEQELPVFTQEEFKGFFDKMNVIEILPRDNTFIDPRSLLEVKVNCGSDQGMYARLVEGKWVWGGGDKSRHFRASFKENIHVIGNADSPNEDDWEVAVPHPSSFDLITGLDIGDTNHAGAVIDSQLIRLPNPRKPGDFVTRKCFTLLSEVVAIGKEISVDDFTYAFMEEIGVIEKMTSKTYILNERCYSDNSSMEKYSAVGDTFAYLQVQAASGGRLFLQGVEKAAGSVWIRVQLLKMLLVSRRFRVSANCKFAIRMLKDLRKGSGRLDFIPKGDDNKHIFDAITYALLMECYDELANLPDQTGRRSNFSVHV